MKFKYAGLSSRDIIYSKKEVYMEKIWAPWRSHDIMEAGYKKWDCLFCGLNSSKDERQNLIICKNEHSFVVMNLFPYNVGHVMIAPYRHTAAFELLINDELKCINMSLQKMIAVLKKVYNPDGFNIGMNLGRAAGAGVAEHLHYHIVPRWTGDANFMQIVGDTKVISLNVEKEYDKIKKEYDKY